MQIDYEAEYESQNSSEENDTQLKIVVPGDYIGTGFVAGMGTFVEGTD